MPQPEVRLELLHAVELAETLTLIRQWLAGPDREQLAASFTTFISTRGYHLDELGADLARFTFLLGHDDGDLFHHEQDQPIRTDE